MRFYIVFWLHHCGAMYLLFVYGCSLQKIFEAKLFFVCTPFARWCRAVRKVAKVDSSYFLTIVFFSTPPVVVFHKGAKTHMKSLQNFFKLWRPPWYEHAPASLWIPPFVGLPINTTTVNSSLLSWCPQVEWSISTLNLGLRHQVVLNTCRLVVHVLYNWINVSY